MMQAIFVVVTYNTFYLIHVLAIYIIYKGASHLGWIVPIMLTNEHGCSENFSVQFSIYIAGSH